VTIDGSIVTGSLVLNDSITTNTTSTLSTRLAAIESPIPKLASFWIVFGSVNNVTLQPYTNQTIALDLTTLTSTCTITNITVTSSSLTVTPLKSIQMKSISSGELISILHFQCIIFIVTAIFIITIGSASIIVIAGMTGQSVYINSINHMHRYSNSIIYNLW
jgi:hypothetical protein